jgi:hypothetical protein
MYLWRDEQWLVICYTIDKGELYQNMLQQFWRWMFSWSLLTYDVDLEKLGCIVSMYLWRDEQWLVVCYIIDKLNLSQFFDLDLVSITSLLNCPPNNRIYIIRHCFHSSILNPCFSSSMGIDFHSNLLVMVVPNPNFEVEQISLQQ